MTKKILTGMNRECGLETKLRNLFQPRNYISRNKTILLPSAMHLVFPCFGGNSKQLVTDIITAKIHKLNERLGRLMKY